MTQTHHMNQIEIQARLKYPKKQQYNLYRPVPGRWQSQSQCQRRGQSQHKAPPRWGDAKGRHRRGKASLRGSIAKVGRRQGEISPERGIHSVAPRYPWVGKTMEGAILWEGLKPQ